MATNTTTTVATTKPCFSAGEMAGVVFEETLLNIKDRVGSLFGAEEPEEAADAGVLARCRREVAETCQLTRLQKVIVTGVLLATGLLFCGLSVSLVLSPTRFAKFYTFGSLCLTAASLFVVSPATQLRSIASDRGRTVAAVVYAAAIVLTLVAALRVRSAVLTAVFVVAQIAAGLWYAASYVPGAQSCLQSTARTILPL